MAPLGDQDKQTHVDSPEVEVRSDHKSTQGNENTIELVLEAGHSSKPQGQEPTSSPSIPTKATADPDDAIVV